MDDPVIIDTDVLIDAGRGIHEATDCLSQIERERSLVVSVVTYLELIVGCGNNRELRELDNFISRFQIFRLNNRISDITSDLLHSYRLSHGLLIPDAFIAATAIFLEYPFVSKNQRDFRFIRELNLRPYPNPFT
ncbi:type II toxin-antitoxin system VapC family toxin [Desulfococcaceae bacterium HSG9]|nr:type II toxin-antitoxin system VapC family toxin [Desulfococcaceae bacterium HSG9]